MSYQLGAENQVVDLETNEWLPARLENGRVVALDEHSPAVLKFTAWVAAGNAPQAADPVVIADPQPTIADVIAVLAPDQKAALAVNVAQRAGPMIKGAA